jgi:hypothetical protein
MWRKGEHELTSAFNLSALHFIAAHSTNAIRGVSDLKPVDAKHIQC